jgi:VWFA-related protein
VSSLWNRFCLVFLFGTASALAQLPLNLPPVSPPASQPAPSASITLNVVVTDKAGNAIRGLTLSDFTLLDNKLPVAIQSFAAHDLSAPRQSVPQTLFLLIDDVNANFSVVSNVRTEIEKFLRRDGGRLPIPVGIYLLTDNGLGMIVPPSTDGNQVAAILHQKEGQLHSIERSSGFYGAEERTQISLAALGSLGKDLSAVNGRKLVAWIGPGWPIFDNPGVTFSSRQQRSFFSDIVYLSGMLRQLGITLYSIDPLGPADSASPRSFLWESFAKPVTKPTKADPGDLALQVFAVHSGGTVRLGSNDITGEIEKCAEDASAWYSITFDPNKADIAGTWHDLNLRVDRPGTRVRTLNGYYAQP